MVATVVRDKYGQSETITGRAEEAGELMTRMEQNDEILSEADSHLAELKTSDFLTHQVGANDTHSLSLSLSLVRSSIRIQTSQSFLFSLQLHLSLFCNRNSKWWWGRNQINVYASKAETRIAHHSFVISYIILCLDKHASQINTILLIKCANSWD